MGQEQRTGKRTGTKEAKDEVQNDAVARILDLFKDSFAIPLPEAMLPPADALPLEGMPHLVGSEPAREHPLLLQGEVPRFPADHPKGYYLMGFWGHGVNSHAFYYVRVDEVRQVCFRLPYGGIYMDNERYARAIPRFLQAYLRFERSVLERGGVITAVEAMGHGRYRVELQGREGMVERSLLEDPAFEEAFAHLVRP